MTHPAAGILAIFVLMTPALPRTWHITPDGMGDAPTIQAGIDSAAVGDTVLLASGVFSGSGNYDVDPSGKILTVRGISGPENTAVDAGGSGRCFAFRNQETEQFLLEGLTLTGGFPPVSEDDGGAVLCLDASPRIVNCIIENSAAGDHGGGVFLGSGSMAILDSCEIRGNAATDGGGISVFNSSAVITNCRFIDNVVTGVGGGANLYHTGSTFSGCIFSGNSATRGGGVNTSGNFDHSLFPLFEDSDFQSNLAGEGGAIYAVAESLVCVGCSFEYNSSTMGNGGGVHSARYGLFQDCSFRYNSATGDGGAVHYGSQSFQFLSCEFTENEAGGNGGAVECKGFSGSFVTCLFVGNSAQLHGGGAHCQGQTQHFIDCTFVENGAEEGGPIWTDRFRYMSALNSVIANGTAGEAVRCDVANHDITCCDIYGNAGGDWTGSLEASLGVNGNISADPLFCDAESGDFMLDAASPCLPGNHPDGSMCGLIGAFGQGCDVYTSIADGGSLPAPALGLFVSPNPSTGEVTLRYFRGDKEPDTSGLHPSESGSLSGSVFVYDIRGRLVRSLTADGAAGVVTWDGRNEAGEPVAAGVYFVRIGGGEKSKTTRVVRIR